MTAMPSATLSGGSPPPPSDTIVSLSNRLCTHRRAIARGRGGLAAGAGSGWHRSGGPEGAQRSAESPSVTPVALVAVITASPGRNEAGPMVPSRPRGAQRSVITDSLRRLRGTGRGQQRRRKPRATRGFRRSSRNGCYLSVPVKPLPGSSAGAPDEGGITPRPVARRRGRCAPRRSRARSGRSDRRPRSASRSDGAGRGRR